MFSAFRSEAISRRNRVLGFQTPERSGWPSGVRGAGADRFVLPSGVCGTFGGGTWTHCAGSDPATVKGRAAATRLDFIQRRLYTPVSWLETGSRSCEVARLPSRSLGRSKQV